MSGYGAWFSSLGVYIEPPPGSTLAGSFRQFAKEAKQKLKLTKMDVDLQWLYPNEGELPKYATAGSAGCDLIVHNFKRRYRAANNDPDIFPETSWNKDSYTYIYEMTLLPGERMLVGFGFAIALPFNHEFQIRPRSGLALNEGITCLNSPGTIDSDYRGEVGAIIINHGKDAVHIKVGDRISQGVINYVGQADWNVVKKLSETERGLGGFGSTGLQKLNDPLADNGYVKTGSHTS